MSAFLLLTILAFKITLNQCQNPSTFTVDSECQCFLKDGHPFRYVSGSFHYFRTPNQNWFSIMQKMRGGGLNVLQTYVEWSLHEPEPNQYDFSGDKNLFQFLTLAKQAELLVVLRPGPYICAERDMGGLPYWILRDQPNMSVRTMDPDYIKYVDRWFNVLLPKLVPYLYQNGGPVILVQIENEYGQYDRCDHLYMSHMRDLTKYHLGNDIVLFRTDIPNDNFYKCDYADGVMVTGDFGVDDHVQEAFETMKKYNPNGPLVVTEFYTGWMDHWGEKHANVSTNKVITVLDEILSNNASVNLYMYFGGTNFGFTNGANPPYNPQVTSYDYNAPLTESGDPTDKYFAIRDTIAKYIAVPTNYTPVQEDKLSMDLDISFVDTLINSLAYLGDGISDPIYSRYPVNFEALSLDRGFMAYSVMIRYKTNDPSLLNVTGLRDRGYVFIDQTYVGVLSRKENAFTMPLTILIDQILTIIVENQGRINYGEEIMDRKGILSNVTLGPHILEDWIMMPLALNDTSAIHRLIPKQAINQEFTPSFYKCDFKLPNNTETLDTFLDPSGWHRGVAFLNGFNLGRYWPVVGPQITLYVPKQLLKPFPALNTLSILELDRSPNNTVMKFVKEAILNRN